MVEPSGNNLPNLFHKLMLFLVEKPNFGRLAMADSPVTMATGAMMSTLPPSLPPLPTTLDYDQLPSYLHPQMPTLSPLPPNYPPPPQFQPYFPAGPPCKCDVANQIRYYNYRTRQGGEREIREGNGVDMLTSAFGSVYSLICFI